MHWGVCNFDLGCVVTGMVLEQPGCGRIRHRPGTLYVSVHYQAKLHLEKPSSVAGRVWGKGAPFAKAFAERTTDGPGH